MNLKPFTPKQSLNKAYLKEKISRTDIELFKVHFSDLLDKINDKGDEEHLKSLVTHFLTRTYYDQSQNQVNPLGKADLVIHTGKSPNDPYGVILEVKSPSNKSEMLSMGKTNVKALHELVLYYLDERITRNRNELKQLIITNIYEWYMIDANEFDKKIYRNTGIKKLYELKKSDNKDNPWFYDELKKYFDAHPDQSLDVTFFDIRDYKKIAANADKQDDRGLIALYKILSPVHLLKLPFANDSNTLQPKFYSELLHIIGLYEYKEGSKKLISRKKEGERNAGSLLENAIVQLDSHDKISRLDKPSQYGDNYQDRLYNVALELVITWINRVLFLKLLEAQLINYHKGDRSYTFLNKDKLKDFDDLDKLFFRVLAKRNDERDETIQQLFGKVPYLNSSLFEPTELEHQTLFINNLENSVSLPSINSTVLKDANGKPLKGGLDTLDYLFAFLNAYDFSSEGAEEIQEDNKQLINASVLGLIFEKINGYKDGSFFTPGFITMYMCRETIRRAVIQKFNEAKGWDCKEYSELCDKVTDKKEASAIINSLKICDPAVGSGHFLVSALNEIISIKSDLRVLIDKEGRSLHYYGIEVVNDELIITDENGDIFEYNPNSKESQRVQETLFHEKQTIIENCLFGVDINPNSVKICRLRLWIELLKNAYYRADTKELETLPNIDINIKTGNSLISRFALDADLKQALKKSKYSIDAYKVAVQTYRESTSKEQKREMEGLIAAIKSDFRTEISANDPKVKLLDRKGKELYNKYQTDQLFSQKLSAAQLKDRKELEDEVNKLSKEIAEIKDNKIYRDAFEWRFEFPEVLSDAGDFVGFDIVIGNPPYGVNLSLADQEILLKLYNFGTTETAILFSIIGLNLLKKSGIQSFIIPKSFTYASNYQRLRDFTADNLNTLVDCGKVWLDVKLEVCIFQLQKSTTTTEYDNFVRLNDKIVFLTTIQKQLIKKYKFFLNDISDKELQLAEKLTNGNIYLNGIANNRRGEGLQSKLLTQGDLAVIGGIDIDRYKVKGNRGYLTLKDDINDYGKVKGNSVLVQNIVSHILNPKPHIKIIATIPNDTNYIILDTINQITILDEKFSPQFLWTLLNSKLINWYVYVFIYGRAIRTMHFDNVITSRIPIPKHLNPKLHIELIRLANLILDEKEYDIEIEKEIDQIMYQMFNLTESEIEFINLTF